MAASAIRTMRGIRRRSGEGCCVSGASSFVTIVERTFIGIPLAVPAGALV
jgi:hypothetical protein